MVNLREFRPNIRSICVFAGTTAGKNSRFIEEAEKVGAFIGKSGLKLIYGGGSTGIMGVVAKSVLKAGGHVIGVLPENMRERKDTLMEANELFFEKSMHQRKQKMYALADAFLVLPGGIGTLDETIEVLTWLNLGIHNKPLFLLDADGYWYPLLRMIDYMIGQEFLHKEVHKHLIQVKTPSEIFLTEKEFDKDLNKELDDDKDDNKSVLKLKEINHFLAYDKAYSLQEAAATTGFDWKTVGDAFNKVEEEKQELLNEIKSNEDQTNQTRIMEEYGDLLFAIINLSRHLNIDHQEAINMACNKFVGRFSKLEKCMSSSKTKLSLDEMLSYWNKFKQTD